MDTNSFRVPDHVADVEADGSWVIVDTKAGRVYALNATASFVWGQIRSGGDWQVAARAMADVTGEPEARVLREVAEFVADLVGRGILIGTEPGPTSLGLPSEGIPSIYVPPSVAMNLPLEARAGSPLSGRGDPDPLLDPLAPLRLGQGDEHR